MTTRAAREGYNPESSSLGGEAWGLAKYAVRAAIDSHFPESARPTTTGDRVSKGGGPVFRTGDGTVATTTQRDGTSIRSEPSIAGIGMGTLLLLGIGAFVVWQVAD